MPKSTPWAMRSEQFCRRFWRRAPGRFAPPGKSPQTSLLGDFGTAGGQGFKYSSAGALALASCWSGTRSRHSSTPRSPWNLVRHGHMPHLGGHAVPPPTWCVVVMPSAGGGAGLKGPPPDSRPAWRVEIRETDWRSATFKKRANSPSGLAAPDPGRRLPPGQRSLFFSCWNPKPRARSLSFSGPKGRNGKFGPERVLSLSRSRNHGSEHLSGCK